MRGEGALKIITTSIVRIYPLTGYRDGLPLAAALHVHATAHSTSGADPTKLRRGGRKRERGGDRVRCEPLSPTAWHGPSRLMQIEPALAPAVLATVMWDGW